MAEIYIFTQEPTNKIEARWRRLSYVDLDTVFGASTGGDTIDYYRRHVRADDGSYSIFIDLDKSAQGGEQIAFEVVAPVSGSPAVLGVDFNLSQASPITCSPGQTSVQIDVTPVDPGNWFFEKSARINLLGSADCLVQDFTRDCYLTFFPAVDPPKISITSSGGSVSTAGDTINVDFALDAASSSDVTIYYKTSGALAAFMTGPLQGATTIAAGSTTGQITLTYSGGASPGDTCTVEGDFERDTVKYVAQNFDADAQAFSRAVNIHVDENLWPFSNHMQRGLENTIEGEGPQEGVAGIPTTMAYGGGSSSDSSVPAIDLEPQLDGSPVLDPVTNEAMVFMAPSSVATAMSYIRQSFSDSFCEGTRALHEVKAWVRTSYCTSLMGGADAGRNYDFHRLSIRIRTQDRNHAVVFRTDAMGGVAGRDWQGNLVPIFGPFSDGRSFWLWRQYEGHPVDFDYGVVEDEHGIRMWMIHHVDPTVTTYTTGNGIETPGVDEGNPIHRPSWHSSQDNSDIVTLAALQNLGTLAHSFTLEWSDTALAGAPTDFWPRMGNHWMPRGSAILDAVSPTSHIFTAV